MIRVISRDKVGSIPGFHGVDCIYFTWSKN
jgi:hypothetical protein